MCQIKTWKISLVFVFWALLSFCFSHIIGFIYIHMSYVTIFRRRFNTWLFLLMNEWLSSILLYSLLERISLLLSNFKRYRWLDIFIDWKLSFWGWRSIIFSYQKIHVSRLWLLIRFFSLALFYFTDLYFLWIFSMSM